MSPFSLSHILDQVVRDQAGRLALDARQHGRASDIPESYYMERIADRAGVTKRQLYRWLAGEASPSTAMLLRLCEICETTLPIEWLNREVGLGYYRKGTRPVEHRDLVAMVSHELQDASGVARDVLRALEDGVVTIDEGKTLVAEIDDAIDALTGLNAAVRAATADPTRPEPQSHRGAEPQSDRASERQPVTRLRTA